MHRQLVLIILTVYLTIVALIFATRPNTRVEAEISDGPCSSSSGGGRLPTREEADVSVAPYSFGEGSFGHVVTAQCF